MDKTSYSVAPRYNLVLIIFWCTSLKKFRCSSKFLFSLTQWCRTKLRAIVPNTNYFQPIILKLKTFIYNSDSKIMHNFCSYGGNTPPVGKGKVTLPGKEFFVVGICRMNTSKYAKLIVEPYIYDNLNHNYWFFSFITKIFLLKMKEIHKFGLNYHRYIVQPLVLRILRRSFWKY